jgi:DNA mismatch repair ATPase MutL
VGGPDGLYVLDQHAAAERHVRPMRRAFACRTIATQRLLILELVELLPAEMATDERSQTSGLGVELAP